MEISAPYGYDAVAPLQKHDRVLMPAGNTPAFCRRLNAIAVSYSEFTPAGRDYPIVFAATEGGRSYAPVIVLGLAEGVNLFVDAAGNWDPSTYLPAYVRRYPFCLSKVYVEGKPRGDSIVCVAKSYLDSGGVALFDAEGRASAHWQSVERLLAEYEADLDRTARMSDALARLGVFAPFSMQVTAGEATTVRLAGMFRVDEPKLAALRPASHKALVAKGFMGRIYAHLHSLENFSRLLARERARPAEPLRDARGQVRS